MTTAEQLSYFPLMTQADRAFLKVCLQTTSGDVKFPTCLLRHSDQLKTLNMKQKAPLRIKTAFGIFTDCAGKVFGQKPPKYAVRTQENRTQSRMPLITKLHSNFKLTKLQIHGWWEKNCETIQGEELSKNAVRQL
jgi:hypothetical protein